MTYSETFGLKFLKAFVIFEISTLESSKNEFLTHKVNFDIGSAFSKDFLYVCFFKQSSYFLQTALIL